MPLKPGIIAEPPAPPPHLLRPQSRSSRLLYAAVIALSFGYYLLLHQRSSFDYATLRSGCTRGSNQGSTRTRVPSGSNNPAYLIRATHGAAGGNAVDAAVTTTLCTGVVNMFSSGIGGGGFMTVRVPPSSPNVSSEVYAIDFRETAPALSNETMYVDNPLASRFGGELRGLEEAHRRWGILPWKQLVEPAARLAAGWIVQPELERRMTWFPDMMLNDSDWSSIFAPNGRLLRAGESIHRTNLSRTLYTIAEEGPDAFYKGPIADAFLTKVRSTEGIMTHEDMEGYTVKVSRALKGTYRGKKVYVPHAPTSGLVLLHMLNLLEHYGDFVEEGRTVLNAHRFLEAMNPDWIGDPAFHDSVEHINSIPTKAYADQVFPNVTDDRTHSPEYYNPVYDAVEDHGTSHSSVVDANGMSVSITSTVNLIFGSGVMDPVTGVILNDEMDDFSTPGIPNAFGLYPSPFNYPEPGKRPLSSTAPIIIESEDGAFYASLGGSGGSRIFPAVFQTLLNLDWGMDVSAAIEYGRMHDQLFPLIVDTDDSLPVTLLDGLRQLGHNISVADSSRVAAVIQGIVKVNGTLFAASDSRKNGIAAGY
ncbi:gamma-glutamyltranspeptidase [Epithele typhae]|uniref:gamma-glutamyltranspeptidase n=1 Tax=Epithele typhae TaxID=378194 RepID=UPI002008D633|nr:gamma-glutamyltranspeptidase [Epithele typhae]KAH9931142.1 gamma-glutamyltranspeptidase [Epithele typhae]